LAVAGASLGDLARSPTSPVAQRVKNALTPDQLEQSLLLLDPLDPIHYIGHAAPSALLFQNGRQDKGIPVASALRLQQAGSDPKRILWYDGGHGLTPQAVRDRAAWLHERLGIDPLPLTFTRPAP
jgi:fermentation-respiration switch protein FrsA (DUF1100 family)